MKWCGGKKRLADTLETALEAFIGTAQDGRILAWNHAATELTGWSADEVRGKRYQDILLIPEDRLAAASARDEFIREGRSSRSARRETEVLRKDGSRIAVEMTVNPIADGGDILFNLFMHDISARKHAENALRESREELQTIADNLPVLIGYIDADYRVGYVNAIWKDWFGKSPAEVNGRPLDQAIGPELWARARPLLDKGLQGLKLAFESTVPILHGERTLRLTVIPDDDHQGNTRGVYMMIIDISDRKRLEERLQREALEDPLTGLPNRRAILRRIEEAACGKAVIPARWRCFFWIWMALKASTTALATTLATKCCANLPAACAKPCAPMTPWRGWPAMSSPSCWKTCTTSMMPPRWPARLSA